MSGAQFSHQARKRFGQNFLVDNNIIDKIISAIAPKATDNLIEIGPGKGALTQHLLRACPTLTVIELDRDLAAQLHHWRQQYPELKIIQADVLKVDFAELAQDKQQRVIGNLPYNISTPLIFHLLNHRHLIEDMTFMLQKEVVQRLAASPNSKLYGRLSIMVQYCAQVENLFMVSPGCFSPPPQVTSAMVRLTPYRQLPVAATDETLLNRLVAICFQSRRKTLRNSLRKLCGDDIIARLPIDTGLRPEALSVREFVELSNDIHQHTQST